MLVAVALAALLCLPLLVAGQRDAEASAGPCPQWSIQGLFDDPNGDWDHDRVPNRTELDIGESPCEPVDADFCVKQPTLCTHTYVTTSTRCGHGMS